MSISKNNLDTLISKITEETCTELVFENNQSDGPVNLRKYFEERLNEVDFNSISDYLDQQKLTFFQLHYEMQSKCYRLQCKEYILDFPSNWSIFKDIANVNLIYLDSVSDKEYLLDVFSEVFEGYHHIVLVREDQKIQLILLAEEQSFNHVEWMKNYFMKKNMLNGLWDEEDNAA